MRTLRPHTCRLPACSLPADDPAKLESTKVGQKPFAPTHAAVPWSLHGPLPACVDHSFAAGIQFPRPPALPPCFQAWFANLAKAADAVDIPLCTTVALVDAAGSAAEQSSFHTTG